jgi:hypothetical protein
LVKALGAHVAALKPDVCQVLRERNRYQVDQAAKEFGVTLTPATAGAVLWLGSMNVWNRSTFDAIAKRWKFNPKAANSTPTPKPQKGAAKPKTKPAAKPAKATPKKRRAA